MNRDFNILLLNHVWGWAPQGKMFKNLKVQISQNLKVKIISSCQNRLVTLKVEYQYLLKLTVFILTDSLRWRFPASLSCLFLPASVLGSYLSMVAHTAPVCVLQACFVLTSSRTCVDLDSSEGSFILSLAQKWIHVDLPLSALSFLSFPCFLFFSPPFSIQHHATDVA